MAGGFGGKGRRGSRGLRCPLSPIRPILEHSQSGIVNASPPRLVLRARQTLRSTLSDTNRTLPSHRQTCTPPVCRLRAANITGGLPAGDATQGGLPCWPLRQLAAVVMTSAEVLLG